jgi:hypothetical protein
MKELTQFVDCNTLVLKVKNKKDYFFHPKHRSKCMYSKKGDAKHVHNIPKIEIK